MSEPDQKLTKQEIEHSLKQIEASEQNANTLIKADNKLIAIGAISYGLSVLSFGYAGTFGVGTLSEQVAFFGFFAFCVVLTKIHKKHKELGVKQRQKPKTLSEYIRTFFYAAFFALAYGGGFLLNQAGFSFAPVLCGIASSAVIALCMYKFPNFPLSSVQGKDNE